MFSQVYEPKGYDFDYITPDEVSTEPRRPPRRAHPDRLGRVAHEPAAEHRRHPRRRRCRACRRRAARRRQHVRDARTSSSRSSSARTSSSTRRRSTSAATRTWSAASPPRTTRRSRSGCASCRSRSAPCPARSTPGSCCAASRRSPCGCASTARTPAPSSRSSTDHPRVERRALSRPARPPGSRDRRAPDARLRRHGLVPRRVRAGGRRPRRADEAVDARREPRRRREPDRAPGPDDARLDGRRPVRLARQPRAAVGRDRVGRRSRRGPRAGARAGRALTRACRAPLPEPHRPPPPRPHRSNVGCYLVETDDGLALFDCGPTPCIPSLEAGLAERGLELGDVSHLLLSHIHFDHAGAAGALVREHPALQVHVSAIGAPHLVEPSRLEASARRLYGDTFDALWGELVPRPGREHPRRRRRRARAAVLPEHRACEPPRLDAARRRHALRGRLDGGPHRAGALRPAPDPAARHRPRGLGGDDRGDRAPRARPAGADPLRGRSRTCPATSRGCADAAAWADRVAHGMDEETFVAAARADCFASDPDEVEDYDQAAPYSQCYLGLERYWRKRGESAA